MARAALCPDPEVNIGNRETSDEKANYNTPPSFAGRHRARRAGDGLCPIDAARSRARGPAGEARGRNAEPARRSCKRAQRSGSDRRRRARSRREERRRGHEGRGAAAAASASGARRRFPFGRNDDQDRRLHQAYRDEQPVQRRRSRDQLARPRFLSAAIDPGRIRSGRSRAGFQRQTVAAVAQPVDRCRGPCGEGLCRNRLSDIAGHAGVAAHDQRL